MIATSPGVHDLYFNPNPNPNPNPSPNPYPNQARAPNAAAQRTRAAEIDALLANGAETVRRSPLDSPRLAELYAPGGFLEGGPLGAKAQQHLWTEYQASDGGGEAASGGVTLDMLDF